LIRLVADNDRRCVLIYIDTVSLPILGRTLSKFLQAISHKVRPYRPEEGELLGTDEVLFVRVPQSKTIEETLLLQERAILNFLRELGEDVAKIDPTDVKIVSCIDPLQK
jgi:hypothetical protein